MKDEIITIDLLKKKVSSYTKKDWPIIYKAYNYALVSEELGLGDLIESYIEKLEKAENSEIDLNAGLVTSAEEADKDNLTEEEFEEWGNFIDNEVEAEAEMLEKFLAGDL